MSNPDTDPFQQGLQDLEADQHRREGESALALQHLEGLMETADTLKMPPDGETDHLLGLAAIHLGPIEAVEDPEERHARQRELLVDFTAVGNPGVVDVLCAYTGMEPLTEEELGIAAERLAERAIAQERNGAIAEEIYELLDAKAPGLPEPHTNNDLAAFLTTLAGFCYQLRHNTQKADIELRRRNLMEKAYHLVDAGGLDPALRQVVASLLASAQ